jgi:hypothetical protein
MGFPQIISFLAMNDFPIEDERGITGMDCETISEALYYVWLLSLTQIITRLIQICPPFDLEKLQTKPNIANGAILRHKIRTISRGLKQMGISSTFQMIDILKPEAKNIKYIFSRVIHFYEYLSNFKKHCAPSFTTIVIEALRGTIGENSDATRESIRSTSFSANDNARRPSSGSRRSEKVNKKKARSSIQTGRRSKSRAGV